MMRARLEASGTLAPDVYGRDLVAEVPVLERLADIETRIVFNMDSGDMQPADWIAIASQVHAALSSGDYDGIVIVHGTDTMTYTASAIALLLGPLPKPVVLTGSQRPLEEARTDARENLIDAALVATLAVPEVAIAFNALALRGVRATKRDAWAYGAFESPNCAPLVELGLGVDIAPHVRSAASLSPFDPRMDPSVLAVRVFPGFDPSLLTGALRVGVHGLVLEAYGTGNLPHLGGSLIPALEEARDRGVPVVIVSQCPRGFVDMQRYAGGAAAADAGAISGGDMTLEAAIAKMMVGLGRYGAGEGLTRYLESDCVGELTCLESRAPASASKP